MAQDSWLRVYAHCSDSSKYTRVIALPAIGRSRASAYLAQALLVAATMWWAATWALKQALFWGGFSALGPVAGSWAAAWQASLGNVVAGSIFAILQRLAMFL